jgi:hypothetical protein
MPASAARIAANQKNAALSTGPRTPEGKERSRANSLKHGLTGQGVVVPAEELAQVDRRAESLRSELRPSSELGRLMVRRMAYLSIRLEKSEQHELAATAARVRRAPADFDEARLAEVEALVLRLAEDPAPALRRLLAMPEGIDRLLEILAVMRSGLLDGPDPIWGQPNRDRLAMFLDRAGAARVAALTMTLYRVDVDRSVERARSELAAMLDAQVARLGEARRAIDEQAIAKDRAGAPDRALFDPSKEATLARKYEAATERGFFRALREFRAAESALAEAPAPPPAAEPVPEALGSCFPGAEAGPESAVIPPAPAPRPAAATPRPLVGASFDLPFSIGRPGPGSP